MTLDDYIKACADLEYNVPPNAGPFENLFIAIELMKLYNLIDGTEAERAACFKYWLELPVDEKLNRETLDKIRLAEGLK